MKKKFRFLSLIFAFCFAFFGGTAFLIEDVAVFSDSQSEQEEEQVEEQTIVSQEVEKQDFDMSNVLWPVSRFTYDGNEHTVTLSGLPDGLEAVYEGNTATNAGTYSATVVFQYDESLYNAPVYQNTTLSWTIAKVVINISDLEWSDSFFEFDGEEHTVTILNLPDGLSVTYTGNTATEAGSYYATATFVYDTVNYELTEDVDEVFLVWKISSGSEDDSALTVGLAFALCVVGLMILKNLFPIIRKKISK